MCASYGLQIPVGQFEDLFQINDRTSLADIERWLEEHGSETVKPTGRIMKNLNPIIRGTEAGRTAELAWWGYLIGGVPSKFPSINTRSERLQDKPSLLKGRALAPASEWYEFQKPSKERWAFDTGEPFAIAVVTQSGKPADGDPVTCYSLVMQPARSDLEYIHDRMPLLIPTSFFDEWLDPDAVPSRELIDAALDAGREMSALVSAHPVSR